MFSLKKTQTTKEHMYIYCNYDLVMMQLESKFKEFCQNSLLVAFSYACKNKNQNFMVGKIISIEIELEQGYVVMESLFILLIVLLITILLHNSILCFPKQVIKQSILLACTTILYNNFFPVDSGISFQVQVLFLKKALCGDISLQVFTKTSLAPRIQE